MPRFLSLAVLFIGVVTVAACPPPTDEIEVKVLAILASEHNKEVNPKLILRGALHAIHLRANKKRSSGAVHVNRKIYSPSERIG